MARLSKEAKQKKQHYKNVDKHVKEHYRRYGFKLHNERQKNIIDYLDKQENRQQYITNLILQDMNNNKSND
jgi:hypothetical protein